MVSGLLPVAWIVDIFRLNIKFSGEDLYQSFYPFNLKVCWADGFSACYDADTYGLTAAIPCLSWYDGPLPLPFFCGLYLAVAGTEAVTYDKVAV